MRGSIAFIALMALCGSALAASEPKPEETGARCDATTIRGCRPERLAAAETAPFGRLAEKPPSAPTGTGAEIVVAQNVLSSGGRQSGSIDVDLCNRSPYAPLFSAIAYFKDPDDQYVTIKGWFKIEKNSCKTFHALFGRFQKIKFAYYAEWERGRRYWPSGGEWKLCLEKQKAFERYNSSNYTCGSREKLVDFDVITVDRDEPSRTINFR